MDADTLKIGMEFGALVEQIKQTSNNFMDNFQELNKRINALEEKISALEAKLLEIPDGGE